MKIAIAFVAVLLVAACAASGSQPAGSAAAPVKSEAGNVVDSQGQTVTTGKY